MASPHAGAITACVIMAVLGITGAAVVAIAFSGTIMMLVAIAIISMITGFVGAIGLILRLKLTSTVDWRLLEEALNKSRESNRVIHATIINQQGFRGDPDESSRYTIEISERRREKEGKEDFFEKPDYI